MNNKYILVLDELFDRLYTIKNNKIIEKKIINLYFYKDFNGNYNLSESLEGNYFRWISNEIDLPSVLHNIYIYLSRKYKINNLLIFIMTELSEISYGYNSHLNIQKNVISELKYKSKSVRPPIKAFDFPPYLIRNMEEDIYKSYNFLYLFDFYSLSSKLNKIIQDEYNYARIEDIIINYIIESNSYFKKLNRGELSYISELMLSNDETIIQDYKISIPEEIRTKVYNSFKLGFQPEVEFYQKRNVIDKNTIIINFCSDPNIFNIYIEIFKNLGYKKIKYIDFDSLLPLIIEYSEKSFEYICLNMHKINDKKIKYLYYSNLKNMDEANYNETVEENIQVLNKKYSYEKYLNKVIKTKKL